MTLLERIANEDETRAKKCGMGSGISQKWVVKWDIPEEGIETEINVQTPMACLRRVREMKELSPIGTTVEVRNEEEKLVYKSTKLE